MQARGKFINHSDGNGDNYNNNDKPKCLQALYNHIQQQQRQRQLRVSLLSNSVLLAIWQICYRRNHLHLPLLIRKRIFLSTTSKATPPSPVLVPTRKLVRPPNLRTITCALETWLATWNLNLVLQSQYCSTCATMF